MNVLRIRRESSRPAKTSAPIELPECGQGGLAVRRERTQEFQAPVVLYDDSHPVGRIQHAEPVREPLQHRPPLGHQSALVVHEEEEVRGDDIALAHGRRRLGAGRRPRTPLGDLGEVLDIDLLTVYQHQEVVRPEPRDAASLTVLDDDFEVDDPDVDLLTESDLG